MVMRDKDKQREYAAKYYAANKDKMKARAKIGRDKQRQRIRMHILGVKANTPCVDCDILYPPQVMEFHHRDGEEKDGNVGDMYQRAVSIERLQQEIDKCDLLCANCHRMRPSFRHKKLYKVA